MTRRAIARPAAAAAMEKDAGPTAMERDAGPAAVGTSDVPSLFRCPICLEILVHPWTSLCGHTCCLPCWLSLDQNQGHKRDIILGNIASLYITCPVCRRATAVGANHQLRGHIDTVYAKETTDIMYERIVDKLKGELRAEIRLEVRSEEVARLRILSDGMRAVGDDSRVVLSAGDDSRAERTVHDGVSEEEFASARAVYVDGRSAGRDARRRWAVLLTRRNAWRVLALCWRVTMHIGGVYVLFVGARQLWRYLLSSSIRRLMLAA